MDDKSTTERLTVVELESTKSMAEATRITSLSHDTLERQYPHLIVRLSTRRKGMKLKHILAIAAGTAQRKKFEAA